MKYKEFERWIKDGNAIEVESNGWLEQTTQYQQLFTRDQLYKYFMHQYHGGPFIDLSKVKDVGDKYIYSKNENYKTDIRKLLDSNDIKKTILNEAPQKLLTKDILKKFPPLYAMDGKDPKDVPIVAKFFTPDGQWSWFATEFDGNDTFFGYVKGFEGELGYFSLSELKGIRGKMGLPVERDTYYSGTLADAMKIK